MKMQLPARLPTVVVVIWAASSFSNWAAVKRARTALAADPSDCLPTGALKHSLMIIGLDEARDNDDDDDDDTNYKARI